MGAYDKGLTTDRGLIVDSTSVIWTRAVYSLDPGKGEHSPAGLDEVSVKCLGGLGTWCCLQHVCRQ